MELKSKASHAIRVVAIDDDESSRELVREALSLLDLEVHIASTGAAGRRLMEQLSPRILIIDENLPGGGLKRGDSNLARFLQLCDAYEIPRMAVETEARDPNRLREDLKQAIRDQIVNPQAWNAMKAYEDQERDLLDSIDIGGLR